MKFIITKTSYSSSTITTEVCCPAMEDAINYCFIDAEWNESTGGIRLWVNPDIQVYEWLVEEYGEPKVKEMPVHFCPFCGEAVEWMQLPVTPV